MIVQAFVILHNGRGCRLAELNVKEVDEMHFSQEYEIISLGSENQPYLLQIMFVTKLK